MTILFALYPNHLTEDPNDYRAVAQPAHSRTNADIADRIISMGSTVTRADILSVLNDQAEAIRAMLLDGDRVNTSLTGLYVSIKGIFNGPTDKFDPDRHKFNLVVIPNRELAAWIQQNASAKKVPATAAEPVPLRFVDVSTGEVDSLVTPGSVANLEGRRLKFDPTDTGQGLFFIAADDSATRVDVVAKNLPSELIFVIPSGLAPGTYTLEVRAILPSHTDITIGRLPHPLTVS